MLQGLLVALCCLELILLVAGVIVLIVAAMVLTEQDRIKNTKKGGEKT